MKLERELFDRTDFTPSHKGPNVLPNDLLFHLLLKLATDHNAPAIKDDDAGLLVTQQQLLSDILAFRNRLEQQLGPELVALLRQQRQVCIPIICSGYAFIVALFAVMAIGGISVPLSPKVTDAEAAHALMTTKASAIISDVEYLGLIQRVKGSQPQLSNLKVLSSAGACLTPIQDPRTITISSDLAPDPNKPSLVILTSGSTGPPKGVAIRRHSVNVAVLGAMTKMGVGVGFNAVQFLPAHHASGLLVNIIPVIVAGGCVELNPGGFDPKRVWDRFCKGGIRTFSAVPTIYVRLVRYWDDNISTMPKEKMAIFKKAVCSIDVFLSGSSALPTHIAQRWTQLTDGNPILERYGSSEGGAIFANSPGSDVTPGSVGTLTSGVDVRLSNGDEGEVLLRSPLLFGKYINNPDATAKAFDKEGYYKTGDIARRVGDRYYMLGRSSVDILKSGGYKISALDIEYALLALPYIAEAIVVGIEDEEFGQRVAAAVVLKDPNEDLTLKQLRQDLRDTLSNYKRPTLLRVVPKLPKTSSMKVPKLLVKQQLFETGHPDIQRWTPAKI